MVVDVIDVLRTQLVAVVVDLVLDVEGAVDIEVVFASGEHDVHLGERVVGEFEHLMQVLVLLLGEVFLAVLLARDGACEIVAGVADALKFADLAKHGAYLGFGLVGEVGIRHVVEVVGDLYLHVVGDALVLLDTGEEFGEGGIVGRAEQFAYHTKHTLYAVGEGLYLFLCLKHGEFGGLHDAGRDETQTEVFFLLFLARGDDAADEFLDLGDKPDEEGRVAHVERGVEGGQHDREFVGVDTTLVGVIAYKRADEVDEGIEEGEHPDDTRNVEHQVGEGSAAGLGIGSEGGEIGCERGADIFTHDQGDTHIDGEHTAGAEYHGDGHESGRRLEDAGEDGSDNEEREDGEITVFVERTEEVDDSLVVGEVHLLAGLREQGDGEEHEGYAEEEVTDVPVSPRVDEEDGDDEGGEDGIEQIEREAE